jgi:hypothetical protein
MASRSKYVKVQVITDAKALAGYRVLGDIVEEGHRVLLLERPEAVGVARRTRKAKAPSTQDVANG